MVYVVFKAPAQFTTNQNEVEFEFEVRDGGSGVMEQNISCSLSDASSGIRTEQESSTCTSPVRFDLEEGRYVFTLRAADRAGLINERVSILFRSLLSGDAGFANHCGFHTAGDFVDGNALSERDAAVVCFVPV